MNADPIRNGPCAKQVVRAVLVSRDGRRFIATNSCVRPQAVCPRAGMPTGVGYELCRSVCGQGGHAEAVALAAAGEAARGATLFVSGHSYVCKACAETAWAAGVRQIALGWTPR